MQSPNIVRQLTAGLTEIGRHAAFFSKLVRGAFTPPWFWGAWVDATGVLTRRCAGPLLIILVTSGAVMAVQAANIFQIVRADGLLGGLIGVFTFRELGPVVAAVLIGAQGGSFVATELGAMRVKEEFDALDLMAVDPARYAAVPRFAGFVIAAPLLGMMANIAGLGGGYLAAMATSDIVSGTFWTSVYETMRPLDLAAGIVKSIVFATIIGHLACFYGYHVRGGAVEVGQAANRAVVLALIGVLAANYVVSSLLFGGEGMQRF